MYELIINYFQFFRVKKLKSRGILRRLENKWVETYAPPRTGSTTLPQVTIHHIAGLLYLYGFAILIGFVILSLELLHYKYYESRKFPFHK